LLHGVETPVAGFVVDEDEGGVLGFVADEDEDGTALSFGFCPPWAFACEAAKMANTARTIHRVLKVSPSLSCLCGRTGKFYFIGGVIKG
jgi:hypothetical protein